MDGMNEAFIFRVGQLREFLEPTIDLLDNGVNNSNDAYPVVSAEYVLDVLGTADTILEAMQRTLAYLPPLRPFYIEEPN